MKEVTHRATHQLVDADHTRLSLTYGPQTGMATVELDGELLRIGEVTALDLGAAGVLRGKTLKVLSIVTGNTAPTNRRSVHYDLVADEQQITFDQEAMVDAEGESLRFVATIAFQ